MLKKSQKLLAVGLALLFLFGVVACGQQPAQEPPQEEPQLEEAQQEEQKVETVFINIATGGTAGTYYPLGGALAEIFNKNIPGVNATAQSTGASVANINMLKGNEVQLALIQNDIAHYAVNGTEMFKDAQYADLRGLATLYPETIQIIALASKNINSVADLKGKKIAVGAAGSGTEANARQILDAAGITYNDITVQYLSFGEAANNMKDGNIDAAFITSGFPTAAVQDVAAVRDIEILSLDPALVEKLTSNYSFYTKTIIPAGTYPSQNADVEAVSVQAMLAVNSGMSDDLAYNMVKALYGNLDRIVAAHTVGTKIKKETALDGMSIDLHPGAKKFFDE